VPLEAALGGAQTLYPEYAARVQELHAGDAPARSRTAPAARRGPAGTPPQAEAPGVTSLHVAGQVWLIAAGDRNVTVQIGPEGVLVVNPGRAELASAVLDEIQRLAPGKRVRMIVDTNDDASHIGGNATLAAGPAPRAQRAAVIAHESSSLRMASAQIADLDSPTETFFRGTRELYFNDEPIELIHVPAATSDGDVIVFFRKSDVVAVGDVIQDLTYPVIRLEDGGTVDGTIAALNRILDITIASWRAQGGTLVVPNQGRIYDEGDVAEYRDMVTIVRDRVRDAVGKGMSLAQVEQSGIARDYDGRYGAPSGPASANAFLETVYRSESD
jgi:glyoxylase-like metal-dependent hydrolase (beta-lactamase superfamily II)